MDKNNFIAIGLIILIAIGVILFGVLFYKLIIEILHSSIHFASWFTSTIEFALMIVAFFPVLILIILFLIAILWSIQKLGKQLSEYFSDLGDKVSQLLNKKPERVLPLFIAVISQTFILMLSKEFTTSDTKELLSFMLYIILAIILITTSAQDKELETSTITSIRITDLETFLKKNYDDISVGCRFGLRNLLTRYKAGYLREDS